jgi:N-hydroxyarylamine O-acetyltransferase
MKNEMYRGGLPAESTAGSHFMSDIRVEERQEYSEEQIRKYLDRIEYRGDRKVNLKNLTYLQKLHLTHIPYENLDPMNGVPISLQPQGLYEKMILHRRGGFCFELQGLFCCLLRSLGYHVAQFAGRFMDERGVIQMRRHRILELTDGLIQEDGISRYCFQKDMFYGSVLMQKERGKEWKPLLGFTEEIQTDDDFVMPSFYCENHPESTFNKYMKVSIFTGKNDLTIVGNTYKVYESARVAESRLISSREEAVRILKEKFNIEVPSNYLRLLS